MSIEKVIGEKSREIKSRLIGVTWNAQHGQGHVSGHYFYEVTEGEGESAVTREVLTGSFNHAITTSPITTAKLNSLFDEATDANPVP